MARFGKPIRQEEVTEMFDAGKNPTAIAAELRVNAGRVRDILVVAGRLDPKPNVRTCVECERILDGHGAIKVCRDCIPDLKIARIYQRYGITKPVWDRILKEQGGHCALCPRDPEHVDHDHNTDRVRGILCKGCNFAMSRVDEDETWSERALDYRLRGMN